MLAQTTISLWEFHPERALIKRMRRAALLPPHVLFRASCGLRSPRRTNLRVSAPLPERHSAHFSPVPLPKVTHTYTLTHCPVHKPPHAHRHTFTKRRSPIIAVPVALRAPFPSPVTHKTTWILPDKIPF